MAPRKKTEVESTEQPMPTSRTRKAPAKQEVATRAPAKVEEDTRKRFNPADIMMTELDAIEKKTGYTNDGIGRHSPRLSTGVLAIDMYMDGGLVAGGWYTVAGGEQSCKSTLTMTLLASVVKQNFRGIGAIFDFEGSTDEAYILSIFKNFKIEIDPATIFGVQDPTTGEWLVRGRFRYYPPSNGERFFDYMAQLRKMLPDKLVDSNGDGYLVYENTNPNRKLVGEYYDKGYFRRNNKFKVLAEDAGAQAIVVVDSYPAMLPDSMDGDDKAGALAIQARMFSDGIKRFRGAMRKKMITILGVNQLRKNPMNQYEPEYEPCFIGSTVVHLADGTVDTIRNIVRKKRDVKVLSFDKKTGEVSAKRIIDWKDNGNRLSSDLVKVCYKAFDHNGMSKVAEFVSTKDHKIWTPSGWKSAGSLSSGDAVYLNLPKDTYTTDQQQVIYGALLGDGSFECNPDSIGWNITYSHVRYQVPYMMWKAQTIDYGDVFDIPNDSSVQRYKPNGELSSFTTFKHYNPDIAEYARILKSNHTKYSKKHVAAVKSILDKIDLRGLAVWYMDDGHFANDRKNGLWVTTLSCDRFNAELKQHAISVIHTLTGAQATVCPTHGKIVIKGKTECLKFQNALSDFIHPSMSYKLFDCADVGAYVWSNSNPKTSNTMLQTEVVSVGPTDVKSKYTRVYDLTVEDNHTYFVGGSANSGKLKESRVRRSVRADGIAVSNCGDALKFYCFAPETELYIDGEFIRAIDVYEEGKQIEVFTRQGKQTATIFKTDGGEYKESITLNYSGIDLTCSIGHAVLTVVQDSITSPRDDQTLVDIGRVSWKRAKDAPLFSYGFVLNDPHYTSKLSLPSVLDVNNRQHVSNYMWYKFITKMFPALEHTLAFMHDMLIPDSKGFLYNSGMIQEVINTQYFTDPNAAIPCGNDYEDISMALAFLDDVFAMLDESGDFIPVRLTEKDVVEERPQFYLDVNEPVTGTVVTNGVLSHNSDVRFRLQSRAIPAPFKGERKVVEEDSVEYEGRVDRYRFISGRSIKNKLGGIPNQEFWMRLWEADGQGKGRGFDPVYDVFFYLKEIKIITGIHNKFKFAEPCPLSKAKRAITWNELRVLVLGDRKQISDLCAKLEIKAFALRKWCFDFVKTDKSKALVTASVVAKGGSIKDDEEGM